MLAGRHSLAADPLFVDPVQGDFSFKSGSPAPKLGIKPLSGDMVQKMGTLRDSFLARFTPDSSMFFKRPPEEVVEPKITKKGKRRTRRKRTTN